MSEPLNAWQPKLSLGIPSGATTPGDPRRAENDASTHANKEIIINNNNNFYYYEKKKEKAIKTIEKE